MNENIRPNNPEDLLTDSAREQELRDAMGLGDTADGDSARAMAVRFLRVLRARRQYLSPRQKLVLGERIGQSIGQYRSRQLFIRIAVAASLLLAAAGPAWLYYSSSSSLRAYAETMALPEPGNNTRLFLTGREVEVESNDSRIDYSDNGTVIAVDSDRVSQTVDSRQTVMNTLVVPFGKRTQITLSDQSRVWLNSGSKLVFPARFNGKSREVYLEGEAIFEVAHDHKHPFRVLTGQFDVQVLGTVFNVCTYRDDSVASAVLVQGSVELNYGKHSLFGQSVYRMTPGTRIQYNSQTQTLKSGEVDPREYTSWREGYLMIRQQKLGEIIKKMERYYNVSVQVDDPTLSAEIFSGNLDLKNSASEVLSMIGQMVNARVETNENEITLKRM